MNVLFLNQARARARADPANQTLGALAVARSIQIGLPHAADDVNATFLEVPPFNRWHRRFMRRVGNSHLLNLSSVRHHVVRSWNARETILDQMWISEPDVVHLTYQHVSFFLGRIQRRLPCVTTIDSLAIDWARAQRFIPLDGPIPAEIKPLEPLERHALHAAPLNIAFTETVASRARTLAPKANVIALHPGLDLEAFRPAEPRPATGPLRVLFVGARWETKGGPELLAALSPRLGRDVLLDVVTKEDFDTPEGVEVHRAEPGGSLMPELFSRADVFCLPTRLDAVPWVVLEAMASGVPVVSTSIGSIPEMVGDGGLISEPGDVDGLAEAIGTVLEDPARRREMGEAGRARVEETYDTRKTTPQLIELLREVAEAAR